MPEILILSDSTSVLDDVRSALEDDETEISELRSGELVRGYVEEDPPDLLVTDLQVGNMGGVAVCLDLHLEESADRIPHVPVLILLDRRADVFLARRSAAEGWLVKPLDSLRLRRAARALIAGGTYFDESYQPLPLPADDPMPSFAEPFAETESLSGAGSTASEPAAEPVAQPAEV